MKKNIQTKQVKDFVKATKIWVKGQKLSIASINLSIKQSRQLIANTEKSIKYDLKKRIVEVGRLKEAEKELKKYV